MKTSVKKELLYLQNYYKDFLSASMVDIVETHNDHFRVGFPSFHKNGTISFHVYPTDKGIRVETTNWDDSFKTNNPKVENKSSYESIDEWMEEEGYMPSAKKSRPKKNYR